MSAPDPSVPHLVTAPVQFEQTMTWVGYCSCGEHFVGSETDVRVEGQPHRDAWKTRLGTVLDRDREEARRLRQETRREQRRSKVEGGHKK